MLKGGSAPRSVDEDSSIRRIAATAAAVAGACDRVLSSIVEPTISGVYNLLMIQYTLFFSDVSSYLPIITSTIRGNYYVYSNMRNKWYIF